MNIIELIDEINDIRGATEDAYNCCPEAVIGTDTSDTLYYVNQASDKLEELVIKLTKEKQVFPDFKGGSE